MGKAVPQLSFLLSSQTQVHFVRTCNKSENKVCLSSETKFLSSMTCPKVTQQVQSWGSNPDL